MQNTKTYVDRTIDGQTIIANNQKLVFCDDLLLFFCERLRAQPSLETLLRTILL